MANQFAFLEEFVGRRSKASDVVTAGPVARLAATLGLPQPASKLGDALPPGWQGLYFGPALGPQSLRPDGQAGGTAALPAVPLKRYRVGLDSAEFHNALRLGDPIERVSEITQVSVRHHAFAPVVHITHRNEISSPVGLCVVEERESIYFDEHLSLDADSGCLPPPAWQQIVEPDPILLFRFSALRFNSHRIHYDREFAINTEGLPGLVVQAALIAQLLLEMCRREVPDRRVTSFRPRTLVPIHDNGAFTLFGTPDRDGSGATMWAVGWDDTLSLVGRAAFGS